ncbi:MULTISPECIES: hypothetical protein [Paracoccus]|uniref:Uncharacterized protein n=2 Tax=Paracoccus TaxID=265 RepID=A0A1G9I5L9_9RHOB|nr:hypothetical protein [Paracoccus chinensis]SDL20164.1 hypothetical protein SAMN04487971_107143 [Paracoccus chinensis]
MIGRFTLIAVALAALSACGGGASGTVSDSEQVLIQKGTYVYDPNKRHAPVSLSGADLVGLEPR